MKALRTITSIALATILTTSALACGKAGETDNSSDDKGQASEPVVLSGFIDYGFNQSAIDKATWFTDYLKEELNVILEFQDAAGTSTTQILQALMSSGELPDIIAFSFPEHLNNAAEAQLLLNLDEHDDKLPSIFEGDHFKNAAAFYRDNMSGGKDNLYAMPSSVGDNNSINMNPHIRWDLYTELGSPEINTLEDYLPVLKAMQDAYPETEDGQKVYGLSIFSEWDNNNALLATLFGTFYGWDAEYVNQLVEAPVDGKGDIRSILAEDSYYRRGLDFYYKANQMGILDPDSLTQKWDTVSDKYKNGRILFSPWEWGVSGYNTRDKTDAEDFVGYASVWADDFRIPITADAKTGRNWSLGIGAATKHADAALAFYNFYYSFEGMDYMLNGPKGVIWDEDENGRRYVTEEGWNIIENQLEMPGGGMLSDAAQIINVSTITNHTINPASGQYMSHTQWDDYIAYNPTKLTLDWRASHGDALNILDYEQKNGSKRIVKSTPALQMVAPPTNDMQIIISQIGDVIKTNSWQMIYAKDDAEYEAQWNDMVEKANGLGLQDVVDWAKTEFNNALENADKYNK